MGPRTLALKGGESGGRRVGFRDGVRLESVREIGGVSERVPEVVVEDLRPLGSPGWVVLVDELE